MVSSTTAVTVASIGYLSPFFQNDMPKYTFTSRNKILAIMLINLREVTTAGYVEFLLTIVKIVALLTIPMVALLFNKNNFFISEEILNFTTSQAIARSTLLLILWCFYWTLNQEQHLQNWLIIHLEQY